MEDNELDIYAWNYGGINLEELKKWVEDQIASGHKTVTLDISWGGYSDIDGLKLIAEK